MQRDISLSTGSFVAPGDNWWRLQQVERSAPTLTSRPGAPALNAMPSKAYCDSRAGVAASAVLSWLDPTMA